MPSPTQPVEIGYSEWMLCRRVGIPSAATYAGMSRFVPAWAKDLILLFGVRSAFGPEYARFMLGINEASVRCLVDKIIRESAYDLVEVRAAFALGGPRAALDLAAQDIKHEQTLPEN